MLTPMSPTLSQTTTTSASTLPSNWLLHLWYFIIAIITSSNFQPSSWSASALAWSKNTEANWFAQYLVRFPTLFYYAKQISVFLVATGSMVKCWIEDMISLQIASVIERFLFSFLATPQMQKPQLLEPDFSIAGGPSIKQYHVLNDKRHILVIKSSIQNIPVLRQYLRIILNIFISSRQKCSSKTTYCSKFDHLYSKCHVFSFS